MGISETGKSNEEIQKKITHRWLYRCSTFLGIFGIPSAMIALPSCPLLPMVAVGSVFILVGIFGWCWTGSKIQELDKE